LAQWRSQIKMVAWHPEWDENADLVSPEAESLVRLVSKQDPEAREIKALAEEYRKSQDPKLLQELQAKTEMKISQSITLLNCQAVGQAVFLHGLAGDVASNLHGEKSMLATDIIHCIGEAFAVCEEETFSKFSYLQR
jgi:hypothetical protein